jgi:hypothetical protein
MGVHFQQAIAIIKALPTAIPYAIAEFILH